MKATIFALISLSAPLPVLSQTADLNPAIGFSAVLSREPTELVCTITNGFDHDVILRRSNLPWLYYHSIKLKAVMTNSTTGWSDLVRARLPLIDPPAGRVKIPAHTTITGSVRLERLLQNFPAVLQSNDVVLYWSYTVYLNNVSNNYAGRVFVQAR